MYSDKQQSITFKHNQKSSEISAPRVTVLMSVFNGAEYLPEAIESILAQTYSDFEFLIIDDASTDGTQSILREYRNIDRRINIINNKYNIGLTRSLNKGIAYCRGDFIARMDADDISLPDRLEKQTGFMIDNPEIAVSGCSAQLFGACDNLWHPPESHAEILSELFFANCFCHSGIIMRRDFLASNELTYPNVKYAQDYLLWCHCAVLGKLAGQREVLIKYRIHNKSVGHRHKIMQLETVQVAQRYMIGTWLKLQTTSDELSAHRQIINCIHKNKTTEDRDAIAWMIKLLERINNKIMFSVFYRKFKDITMKTPMNRRIFHSKIEIIFMYYLFCLTKQIKCKYKQEFLYKIFMLFR